MDGKYIKEDGSEVAITYFDPENKIVYIHLGNGQYRLYSEFEYKYWTPVSSKIEEEFEEKEIIKETKGKKNDSSNKK